MKHLMIGLIKLYRRYISPLKAPCCRFTPSCSAYALEAFAKRGFFVGFMLTVWRILRCNPFSKGGYDPVPERGLRNPKPSGCAEEANCRHRDNDSSSDAKDTLADIEHSENDGSIEDAPHSEDSIDE